MKRYLKLMRIHHYIKNLLILLPLIFGGKLYDFEILKINLLGFLSFSIMASAIYVINDIKDVEQDRLHPVKCKRPIASKEIEEKNAIIFFTILFLVSALCNYFVYIKSEFFAWIFWGIYFLINFAYSFGLKKVPVIDVMILAGGFLVRVLYGGAISGIEVSNWLCFTVLASSIYMSLGKRRNELKNQGECVRKVLKYYNYRTINVCMYLFFILTLSFYTLWCITMVFKGNVSMLIYFTVPLLFLIIARYSKDIEGKVDGDPVNVLLKDKYLILGCLIYAFSLFSILYY